MQPCVEILTPENGMLLLKREWKEQTGKRRAGLTSSEIRQRGMFFAVLL
jgi:hypothetical protein